VPESSRQSKGGWWRRHDQAETETKYGNATDNSDLREWQYITQQVTFLSQVATTSRLGNG